MRILAIIALIGLGVNMAVAQNPPPQAGQGQPAAPAPVNSPENQVKLDHILTTWETDAKALNALFVTFSIEEVDAAFPTPKKSYGEAKVLKMPTGRYGFGLQISEVDAAGNPLPNKLKNKYVFSENWLYNFDVAQKTIYCDPVRNANFKPDDGPFAFLFGMKATDANKRFRLTYIQEDQYYHWIRVESLTEQDRKDFTIAQLGVVKDAYPTCPKGFPAQVKYRDPAGNTKTWVFKQVIRNDLSKVAMSDFGIEEYKKANWQLKLNQQQGAQANNPSNVIPASGNVPPRK